jgi:GGDEF domain-containing protein
MRSHEWARGLAEHLARTDALTGLDKRRAFLEGAAGK